MIEYLKTYRQKDGIITPGEKDKRKWDVQFEEFWEENYGDSICMIFETGHYFQYKLKGVYEKIEKVVINKIVKDWCRMKDLKYSIQKLNLANNIIETEHHKSLKEFDVDKTKRNVLNGILDLKTKTLSEHSMDYLSIHQANVNFREDKRDIQPTPCWDNLKKLFGNELKKVKWFITCVIFNNMSDERSLFIVGPTRAGKGSVIKMVEEMFSEGMVSNLPLEDLGENFGLEILVTSNLNLDKDSTIMRLKPKAVKFYKSITGRDGTITVNPKGRPRFNHKFEPFFFINVANLLYTLPPTDVKAFFSRPVIAEFKHRPKNTDPTFKDRLVLEASDVFSQLVYDGYQPFPELYKEIEKKKYNIDDYCEECKALWNYWSIPVNVICDMIFTNTGHGRDMMLSDEVIELVESTLNEHDYSTPPEKRLKQLITLALKKKGIKKRRSNGVDKYLGIALSPAFLEKEEKKIQELVEESEITGWKI